MTATSALGGARRWLARGAWAVADQGFFSLSNFALSVVLARDLAPGQYGAFAAAQGLFLLGGQVHNSVLIEPMLAQGGAAHAERPREYLGLMCWAHLLVCSAFGLVMLLAAAAFAVSGQVETALPVAMVGLTAPVALLLWLARRAAYLAIDPRRAALASFAYFTLLGGGALLLGRAGLLGPSSAFLVAALASLLPSALLFARARPQLDLAVLRPLLGPFLRDTWAAGRWSFASLGPRWAPRNLYLVLLPWAGGLEASATLLALLNLASPLLQANIAITTLLIPAYARGRQRLGRLGFLGAALAATLGPSLLWWLVLAAWPERVLGLFYGSRYAEATSLAVVIGALPPLTAVIGCANALLLGEGRFRDTFFAFVVGGIACVALAAPALALGAQGAACGTVASYAAIAVAALVLVLRSPRGATAEPGSGTVPA